MADHLVLLVEDNEVNRNMLVRRLQRAGHRVVTAGDGEAALLAMRTERPGVVLMDMNLPVKDGWTACLEAKQDAAICDIPVIALTAHAMGRIATARLKPVAATTRLSLSISPIY